MTSAGDDLWMQWRSDGSNISTVDYRYIQQWTNMTSASVMSNTTAFSGTNETKITLGENMSTALTEMSSFTIDVYQPMTTGCHTACMITGFVFQTNGTTSMTTSNCWYNGEAGDIDGFRFLTSASSISYREAQVWAFDST